MGLFSPDTLKFSFDKLGEPSRPCHYVCFISPPPGMLLGGSLGVLGTVLSVAGSAQVSLMAETASIPGKQIATTPFTMYGSTMKMPYGTLYDDFNVGFICTKSMVERTFFDVWMNYIHNPHNNYMNYFDDYCSTIVVVKLNDSVGADVSSAANLLSVWQLQECFPIAIAAQELSYASEDYLRLNIQFAYRKYNAAVDLISSPILPGGLTPGLPDLSSYIPLATSLVAQLLA